MRHSDEELLDFDKERLAAWEPKRVENVLIGEDGDLYRNHLVIAKWLDQWAEGLPEEGDEDYRQALREVGAHLRQADLVPGGVLYDQMQHGR
ncbi:hypothetical protein ABZ234_03710 [Nocardiopsis sp. NPDC006198]|uniref:hypothetical protein n=1 Tax=Nocardiopsis sp. NPDC006198 TaxID=3154472 RepID=UPI0033B9D008